MIPWRRHPIPVSPELAAVFARENEAMGKFMADYYWGYEGGERARLADLYAISEEIIDWKNPSPIPERLAPEPPSGLRYWLDGE